MSAQQVAQLRQQRNRIRCTPPAVCQATTVTTLMLLALYQSPPSEGGLLLLALCYIFAREVITAWQRKPVQLDAWLLQAEFWHCLSRAAPVAAAAVMATVARYFCSSFSSCDPCCCCSWCTCRCC